MVHYNPFSAEVMRDPYPVYKRLRAEAPVHYIQEYDAWALAKFDDIWAASMDTRHYTASRGTTISRPAGRPRSRQRRFTSTALCT